MKYTLSLLTLLVLVSCASSRAVRSPATITLSRAGGFSGLEERYVIQESGRTRKILKFPGREETVTADTMLGGSAHLNMFSFLDRNIDSLSSIRTNETGNMTTSLIVNYDNKTILMRWPNLEPPILPTKKLDSLYNLVSPVQVWLSSQ